MQTFTLHNHNTLMQTGMKNITVGHLLRILKRVYPIIKPTPTMKDGQLRRISVVKHRIERTPEAIAVHLASCRSEAKVREFYRVEIETLTEHKFINPATVQHAASILYA